MSQLLSLFAYLSVVGRGLLLSLQSVLVGGVGFIFLVLYPAVRAVPVDPAPVEQRLRRFLLWIAITMAVVQAFWAAADTAVLMTTAEVPLVDVVGAQFFQASIVIVVAAIIIGLLASGSGLTFPFVWQFFSVRLQLATPGRD